MNDGPDDLEVGGPRIQSDPSTDIVEIEEEMPGRVGFGQFHGFCNAAKVALLAFLSQKLAELVEEHGIEGADHAKVRELRDLCPLLARRIGPDFHALVSIDPVDANDLFPVAGEVTLGGQHGGIKNAHQGLRDRELLVAHLASQLGELGSEAEMRAARLEAVQAELQTAKQKGAAAHAEGGLRARQAPRHVTIQHVEAANKLLRGSTVLLAVQAACSAAALLVRYQLAGLLYDVVR